MADPPPEEHPIERARVRLPDRVRLVVLFGGRSAEHDISCVSASHVLAAIDPQRYEVLPIGITRDGRFLRVEPSAELSAVGEELLLEETLSEPPSPSFSDHDSALTDPDTGRSDRSAGPAIPTVVMPILHGPNGEDGTIQGVLEITGVPYVGSGVLSSALAMDKDMAKTVMAARGIPQTQWRTVRGHDRPTDAELAAVIDDLGPVLFVKPANMGSSIGVTRVDASDGTTSLDAAIDAALRFDDVAVLEAGVVGRELECAVLGNSRPRASVLGEVVTDAAFYDFDDKYLHGTARTVIPAALDEATMNRGRALAVETFEALRCEGMARVDMFLRRDGEFLVNEVNTIPGFTPISMYPKLWETSGLPYGALIDELVALALESHQRRASRSVSQS